MYVWGLRSVVPACRHLAVTVLLFLCLPCLSIILCTDLHSSCCSYLILVTPLELYSNTSPSQWCKQYIKRAITVLLWTSLYSSPTNLLIILYLKSPFFRSSHLYLCLPYGFLMTNQNTLPVYCKILTFCQYNCVLQKKKTLLVEA